MASSESPVSESPVYDQVARDLSHPFSFLSQNVKCDMQIMSMMEKEIDKAIKLPTEYTSWHHPKLDVFTEWLKEHSRHRVPVTFKSEWAIMSSILQLWPENVDTMGKLDFRRLMVRLVRMRSHKSFHKHYFFQALVHFEEAVWHEMNSCDFWQRVFVQERVISEEEVALCQEYDEFLTCMLFDDDIAFFVEACKNQMIKGYKVRQFALLIAFMRSKGVTMSFDNILLFGEWMIWWQRLGESHPNGPAYWCGLGDSIKHMLTVLNKWDRRHRMSHVVIKQKIRERNVFLLGRVMQNRHIFINTMGERVTFYATLPEVKSLKRKIQKMEAEMEILNKRLERYESVFGVLE